MLHTKQGRPDMLQGVNGVPLTVAATGVLAARSRFYCVPVKPKGLGDFKTLQ